MLKRFWSDRGGATAIEYALIALMISVTIVGVVRVLGQTLANKLYQPAADAIN